MHAHDRTNNYSVSSSSSSSSPPPRLYDDLKRALASLYNLHGCNNTPTTPTTAASAQSLQSCASTTHDFLVRLQTRNVRRQVQSYQQQQKSLANSTGTSRNMVVHSLTPTTPLESITTALLVLPEGEDGGSSWLACLVLLSQDQPPLPPQSTHHSNHSNSSTSTMPERLFGAQTLLRRCRGIAHLVEAVDVELEWMCSRSSMQDGWENADSTSRSTIANNNNHQNGGDSRFQWASIWPPPQTQNPNHPNSTIHTNTDKNNNNENELLLLWLQRYTDLYCHHMARVNPLVAHVLLQQQSQRRDDDYSLLWRESNSSSSSSSTSSTSTNLEVYTKGHLTLCTLATVAVQIAARTLWESWSLHHSSTTTTTSPTTIITGHSPLLSTTVSIIATTAVRLCYSNNSSSTASHKQQHPSSKDQEDIEYHSHVPTSSPTPATDSSTESTLGPSVYQWIRYAFGAVEHCILQPNDTATAASAANNHPGSTAASTSSLSTAAVVAFLATVAAWPDTVWGSPGGARGRLSMDPRALRAAARDLRQKEVLYECLHLAQQQFYKNWNHNTNNNIGAMGVDAHNSIRAAASNAVDLWIVQTAARWAVFVSLSRPVLQLVQPLLQRFWMESQLHSPERAVAGVFVLAVYESALCDVEHILSINMGLTATVSSCSNQNGTKKQKPTNRAKKRQKEKIDNLTTDSSLDEAHAELHVRGEIATQMTMQFWPALQSLSMQALADAAETGTVDGEGPIGCLALCATAVLTFIVRNHHQMQLSSLDHSSSSCLQLFRVVAEVFQHICSSHNATVRALALEPLFTLHGVLLDVVRTEGPPVDPTIEAMVVDHFFQCAHRLSTQCAYPSSYFSHLCAPSDSDVEIERNDIRDLLRTVAGSVDGGSTGDTGTDQYPLDVTNKILCHLVEACHNSVVHSRLRQELCPEAVVHAFSSLAKPMNHLSRCFSKEGGNSIVHLCIGIALQILVEINQMAVDAFLHSCPTPLLLPFSRIVCIGSASYAPFLAAIASVDDAATSEKLSVLMDVLVLCSILSLERFPELPGPSILHQSIYDLRGTMRGPAGEDHVGCLTLMRCCREGAILTERMVTACTRYTSRLCDLHHQLKCCEMDRGPQVFHGRGVTPQTRRILVGTLCHLELISQGRLGASTMLAGLFHSGILGIASFQQVTLDQDELFRICETTLDLASFTTTIAASLFDSTGSENDRENTLCLEVLTNACVRGYQGFPPNQHATLVQWNRLRAALFALLKKSALSDCSERCASIIIACVHFECESIKSQFSSGTENFSTIFTDEVVSPESIPSGLFVRVLFEIMMPVMKLDIKELAVTLPHCVQALTSMKVPVLTTVTSLFPQPCDGSFVDPRPTLLEAWLQVMTAIAEVQSTDQRIEALLVETCVAIVCLLLYPSLGKLYTDRVNDCGLSSDGPQSLAITTFFGAFFRYGSKSLQAAGQALITTLSMEEGCTNGIHVDQNILGIAIIVASLFRACQGALPPWAIESIPDVYSSLFGAIGEDVELFGYLIHLSMELRLNRKGNGQGFGGVGAGQLLSGRFFESMSNEAKTLFVGETKELAKVGGSSWRKLKGLIKQACGGKKKDSHFSQKPSPTRWEFDRV